MFTNKKISTVYLTNLSFCFFPISLIIGSPVVNLNLLVFLILSFFHVKKNNYKFKINYANLTLTCFFLFVILSTIINIKSLNYEYALKSVFLLRFLFLYIIVEILLINKSLDLKKFFITCLLCTAFVSLDIIYQFIFGYDIFGYPQHDGQIAGPFYSEGVGGSYVQRFSLFSIFGSLFFFKEKYKKYFLFVIILLISLAVFIATNRMSVLLIIFSIFLLIIFYKKNRLTVVLSFMTFLLGVLLLFNYNEEINARYVIFYEKIIKEKGIQYGEEDAATGEWKAKLEVNEKTTINLYSHNRIYYTVVESWKNDPIIGGGYKSFRVKCKDVLHKKKNIICSTHPHNYHLEVLHDFGIIGFILISIFVFLKIYDAFKFHFSSSRNQNYDLYFIPITIIFLSEIWPLKSTGMLFTTWNGTIVWLIVSLTAIYELNKKK